MKKIIYALTIMAGIAFGIFAVNFFNPVPQSAALLATSTPIIEQPTATPTPETVYYRPVTLRIPKLEVDAIVEEVGQDSEGRMDVPQEVNNVAWYEPGFIPGTQGNAVLAGHFDTPTGEASVFYNLSNLEPGDEIQVIDEKNNTLTFIVESKETYLTDEFPLQKVFGETDGKMLNLITCEGTFNQSRQLYSERLVIFSRLKEV